VKNICGKSGLTIVFEAMIVLVVLNCLLPRKVLTDFGRASPVGSSANESVSSAQEGDGGVASSVVVVEVEAEAGTGAGAGTAGSASTCMSMAMPVETSAPKAAIANYIPIVLISRVPTTNVFKIIFI
jgi:hypothetical protein